MQERRKDIKKDIGNRPKNYVTITLPLVEPSDRKSYAVISIFGIVLLQWGSLTIFCGALNLKLRDCAEGEGIGVPTNENFTGTPLPDTRGGSRGGAGEGAAAPFSAAPVWGGRPR